MAVIKLTGFTGEAPRITPRLLPDSGAQLAQSVRLEDGELSPFRKPYLVEDLAGVTAGTVKTIYRHLGDWLHWPTVVHAVPGPVAQDRLYYTGDGVPKMRVGSDIYPLAVTAPTTGLTATNGSVPGAVFETRLYVYTHVTDFGEESEPNAASNEVIVSPGNVVTLSGFGAIPTGRAITKQRIYRSVTSGSGVAGFYFIAERAASTGNFSDNIAQEDFNELLPSIDWNPPSDSLSGLVSMPNGMMAAFSGKDLYFCEPYRPHAWPEKYALTTDYDIVALAVYGTTLVIGTTGNPYLASGSHPETMVMEKLELNMPCLSAQGMVDLGYAVAYPSHDGLVVVQNGAASVTSAGLMTRDQWLKLLPDELVCGQFYGRYFASYDYTEVDGSSHRGTAIFDLSGSTPFLIRSHHKADAFFYEITSGALFMLVDTAIYEWDSKYAINDVFTWKSKVFVLPKPASFGAILVESDNRDDLDLIAAFAAALEEAIDANETTFAAGPLQGELNGNLVNTYAINGDALIPLPSGPTISVNVYADGRFIASVSRTGTMQRLPGGRLARQWEIEVSGNTPVLEITMAGTGQELRGV